MPLTEIYRAPTASACEHRAFVLRAVGIPSDIVLFENAFVLFVPQEVEAVARNHLARYEQENAPPAAVVPARTLRARDGAYLAPLIYSLLLIACAYLAGKDAFGFDWYAAGALSSAIERTHEWWRAATALTLHVDHGHLLRNIGFGALFIYAAARLLGPGVALAAGLCAAVLGNVIDSALMPRTHVSIGASTMVFATLGLISAYSWRVQMNKRMRWAHRWAPLVVGVMLLGFLGSGGEDTDVLGHLAGFFSGVLFGVALARAPEPIFSRTASQSASIAAALALIALAWLYARVAG